MLERNAVGMARAERIGELPPAKLDLLVKRLRERRSGASAPAGIPRQEERSAPFPLSSAQERLWFLARLHPESPAYNVAAAVGLSGPLVPAALAWALAGIVRRHEVLRAGFVEDQGIPLHLPAAAAAAELPVVDLGGLAAGAAESEACRWGAEHARRPFDLGRPPLLRTVLLRLGAERHVLLLAMHHIVSDAASVDVLVRELAALYEAFVTGARPDLPELPVQYRDFVSWQRERLQGERLETQLGYWRETLVGLPVLALPADRPRPAAQSLRGGRTRILLPAAETAALRTWSESRGITLFATLLAAFQALLLRYTGQEDLAVGSPVAGRGSAQLEPLIGLFVNTLVLRTDLSGDPPFAELAARVWQTALDAFAHQEAPFARLVQELAPERLLAHAPLFQVLFTLQSEPPKLALPGIALRLEELDTRSAKFDVTLALTVDDGLRGWLEYNADLFDAPTAARLAAHLERLLAAVAGQPGTRLSDLPLLAVAERQQLLVEWNAAAWERWDETTIHRLFEAQAARTPEAVALICGTRRLTYRELDLLAGRLAASLRGLGVGPEVLVGVLLERSPALVVGLLGILKAGGAYLPLDSQHPAERLAFLLADAGARLVLTRPSLARLLPDGTETLCLGEAGEVPAGEGSATCGVDADAASLAYVIYTSGSTGTPKGVALEHRGAVGLLCWARATFADEELAGVLAATSIGFDLSVFELFAPLCWGGTAILAENALQLPALPAAREVRLVNTVPAVAAELARPGGIPASVRTVSLAGEPLRRELAERLYAQPGIRRVWNLYGPSEDTTYSTCELVERGGEGAPAIGRPLPGTRACVLDRRLRPVPLGAAGELCLGSRSLARGYLGRAGLTAAAFVPDPFAAEPGARMYRTGDLVRQRPDGGIEFLGRSDHQVKVRGFRIELGEIESVLAEHPGLAAAAVIVREDKPGERRLIACVVPAVSVAARGAEGPQDAELRAWLRRRLPDPMVPGSFLHLEALPLTANGKVDRRALAQLATARRPAAEGARALTPLEELLAGIWSELLGSEWVGAEGHFFALGGHSLLATRLVARLREVLGIELPLSAVFEAPLLAAFAERVGAALGSGRPASPAIRPRSLAGEALPSFAQERLWFLDRLEPGGAVYNMPAAVRLVGALDAAAFAAALGEIVRRHEALRTVFAERGGRPVMRVLSPSPCELPIEDLRALPAALRMDEARRRIAAEAARPFDLERGPLLRARLLQLGDEERIAVITLHHVAGDGWSAGLMLRELSALYPAFAAGRPSPLPEPRLQYADYAAWQREWLQGEALEALLDPWRQRLAGAPEALALPTDRPRPAVRSSRGSRLPLGLDERLMERLGTAARRQGVTRFMLLATAWSALLARYSGQRELLIGFPVANRTRAELEDLIGLFVNTLVLRTDVAGDPTVAELLGRVRGRVLEAAALQDLPFERLVEELRPARVLSHAPLVQVLLVDQELAPPPLLPGLSCEMLDIDTGTTKFDLTLSVAGTARELAASLAYDRDLFDAATAGRMAGHLRNWLERALADSRRPLSAIDPLSEAERWQLLTEWNQTDVDRSPAESVPALVETRAGGAPDSVAVVCGDLQVTYRELLRRAGLLARRLQDLGIGPEARVGVCAERSPDMVAALLGVWKAGAAYVPLDPEYPRERLAFLLEDAAVGAVLAQPTAASSLPPHGAPVVNLEGATGGDEVREDGRAGGRAAYLIYTSGSSGRPKGVVVSHGALANRLLWSQEEYPLDPSDRVLQSAAFSFDFSVWELFGPLLAGARLVLAERRGSGDGSYLVRLIAEQEVTTAHFIPSLFRLFLDEPEVASCHGLRRVFSGGEPLPGELAARFFARLAGAELYNQYGPTETTIDSTFWRCRRGDAAPEATVPIGRPIANTRAYLLDHDLRPVPAAVPGELHIGGMGLARGYLGRPELTAERFVPDPFAGRPGQRLYRTGDVASWRPDGALLFLGRVDQQVKLRGFRIEPGEIDAALAGHPGVRQAATVVREDRPGDPRLVAYVVPRSGAGAAPGELRGYLAERLPGHLVPSIFVPLDELPMTVSGKLDRRALPVPGASASGAEPTAYVAPRGPVEELLAGIWSALLGIDRVGADDDFFALGGHSLLAARVAARIRETLGVELPLRLLFEAPTVAGLAAALSSVEAAGPEPLTAPVLRDAPLPLSFAQQRLWLLHRMDPASPAYHVPGAVRLAGPLRPEALARALAEVVRRHEALRTVFPEAGGEPRQLPLAAAPVALPLIVLDGLPAAAREEEVRRLATAEAHRPFALAAGPLWRIALLRLGPADHVVLLTLHHIVFDGWSMGLLLEEIAAFYRGFVTGEPVALPELPVQYADWASWQRGRMADGRLAAHLAYWREALAAAPPRIALPVAGARPAGAGRRAGRCGVVLPGPAVGSLHAFGRRHGSTLFMTLLAALQGVLGRWTGQQDLVVGTVVAGRDRVETERLIGCFVNFVPLRTRWEGDPAGAELLARVLAAVLAAYAHQGCPFELVVEALNPERRPGENPLYNVGLLLQSFPCRWTFGEELEGRLLPQAPGAALLDLRWVAQEEGDGLRLDLEYAADLFDAATAEALLAAYAGALDRLVEQPEAPLSSWELPAVLAAARLERPEDEEPALAVAATFTADPIVKPLRFWTEELGAPCRVEVAPYNQVFQQLLDPASLLSRNRAGGNVVLVRLEDWRGGSGGMEAGMQEIERSARDLVAALAGAAARSAVPLLVCFCPPSPGAAAEPLLGDGLRRLEQDLCDELGRVPGVCPVSGAELADLYPVAEAHDPHADRLGHVPYTPALFTALATLVVRKLHALTGPPYKVIALDCDNTLWRGVCAEEGPEGVAIDEACRALQELMVAQHDAGMLLCLCSKNNEADVAAVFERGPRMPLRREHLTALCVNWRPKSENLRALAGRLGLGLDSFIFVDDNPVECAEVESACPEVLVVPLPEEPREVPGFLRHVWAFDRLAVTAEDRRRSAFYREELERESCRAAAPSLAEFLAGLELRVEIAPLAPHQLERVAQLTQRTNQFNVTTIRRTEREIERLCASAGAECLVVEVRDRFGDYGLVGAVLFAAAAGALRVDTFLLSCRVLGRGVEHRVLARLGEIALERGLQRVEIPFLPTARNHPARDFLEARASAVPDGEAFLFNLEAGRAATVPGPEGGA